MARDGRAPRARPVAQTRGHGEKLGKLLQGVRDQVETNLLATGRYGRELAPSDPKYHALGRNGFPRAIAVPDESLYVG